MCSKFSCVASGVDRVSLNLLQAVENRKIESVLWKCDLEVCGILKANLR